MKKLVFLFILCSGLILKAQTGEKNFIDQNYIEVTGKAEIEVIPDEIYLKILISEADNKSKISLEEKERKMYDALKNIGIDVKSDLAVKDFASNFNAHWLKKDEIQSSKEYQLIVHDTKTLSLVFIELEKLDISNITIDHVDHSLKADYQKQVKVNAIKAARDKADYLAEAIDQGAGKALFIQEQNFTYYRPNTMSNNIMVRGVSSIKKEELPEIEFEKIKFESTMLVRFAIQNPKRED
ncbi:SIMPL domain-containing protein [Saccharicrinis sp. FJH54]|uniref:SIMPL domain-containing protein n=1 Tax=Saccharicrinis sp. FJH54 TaxID=3344665 RepID=UPI0035D48615